MVQLHRHRGADVRMRIVVLQSEIFELEIEDGRDVQDSIRI